MLFIVPKPPTNVTISIEMLEDKHTTVNVAVLLANDSVQTHVTIGCESEGDNLENYVFGESI